MPNLSHELAVELKKPAAVRANSVRDFEREHGVRVTLSLKSPRRGRV